MLTEHADLRITPEESAVIETALQEHGALDEATAVLVAEMAKLQALTVGATEDYVVVREFAKLATDQQKQDYLPAVAKGEKIAAFALTEPGSGSDVASMETEAVETPDGYRVDGEKTYISNGGIADHEGLTR